MQHVASYSFLLIVYARYMETNNKIVNCGDVVAKPYDLDNLAKTQVIINQLVSLVKCVYVLKYNIS